MGLMQLMPETARTFGVVNPLDPVENVTAGSRFLGQLLERYSGDLVLALGAYNAGPAAVDRYRGIPPYEETRDYVTRILRDLKGDGRLRSELARAEQ
jgi:soluble lytic murein transglycosylase-like protein